MNKILRKEVIKQCGGKNIFNKIKKDVADYGIDSEIILSGDSVQFFNSNRKVIMEFLEEEANSLDTNTLLLLHNYSNLGLSKIAEALYDLESKDRQVRNIIFWYILEAASQQ